MRTVNTPASLAEQLVSGYLRFIIGINPERTLLQTLQPLEPIPAYTSAREMTLHPRKRLGVVKALYANSTQGTILVGNIGELVAALILTFAFDKVHGDSLPNRIKFADF